LVALLENARLLPEAGVFIIGYEANIPSQKQFVYVPALSPRFIEPGGPRIRHFFCIYVKQSF
jgi:hypothetical protein